MMWRKLRSIRNWKSVEVPGKFKPNIPMSDSWNKYLVQSFQYDHPGNCQYLKSDWSSTCSRLDWSGGSPAWETGSVSNAFQHVWAILRKARLKEDFMHLFASLPIRQAEKKTCKSQVTISRGHPNPYSQNRPLLFGDEEWVTEIQVKDCYFSALRGCRW